MLIGRVHRRALLRFTGGAALGVLVPRPLLGAGLTRDEQRRLAGFSPIHVPLERLDVLPADHDVENDILATSAVSRS
jgi:hypothetical protein